MDVPKQMRRAGISRGLVHALKLARLELTLSRRHRRSFNKIQKSLKDKVDLRLHLGCGENRLPGWINIDLLEFDVEAQLDLREDWPFLNGTVSRIYSEHTLEHFEYPGEVRHFLSESMRVLKPGGVIEVGVPDTEWPLKAYGNDADQYWKLSKALWIPPETECETQLDVINYHFRLEGEHKYAWDLPTLTKELNKAGFAAIEKREFDPSFDSESRKYGTLYMRARKPISAL